MEKEDLFYIILAIGWVAYGFYKNNVKAKLAQQQKQQAAEAEQESIEKPEASSASSLLDVLLQGLDTDESFTKKKEDTYSPPKPVVQPIPVEFKQTYIEPKKAILDGDNAERQILKDKFKQGVLLDMQHHNAFDLRQAMIHTIILSRPEY